jgi:hypothetical protein
MVPEPNDSIAIRLMRKLNVFLGNLLSLRELKGEGEFLRKPSAAERARFLSACREESGARTGSEFSSRGKIRVFRRDSPEPYCAYLIDFIL